MATKKGTVVVNPATPTVDVTVTEEGFQIVVGPGNYELYVDKNYKEAITQDQSRERFLPMEKGEHALSVYSQGRFITPVNGVVGVFGMNTVLDLAKKMNSLAQDLLETTNSIISLLEMK